MPQLTIRNSIRRLGTHRSPFPAFPVSNGMLLRNEGLEFDGFADGAAISQWTDLSPNVRHWAAFTTGPKVDKVRTANGHATLRFDGTFSELEQDFFLPDNTSPYTGGMEIFVLYQQDNDPPTSGVNQEAGVFTFNQPINFPPHQPYTDGTIYECFGRADRPQMPNPTTSLTTFRVYNVRSKSDGSLWRLDISAETVVNVSSGYTYQQRGLEPSDNATKGRAKYHLGRSYRKDTDVQYNFKGNMVALSLWDHVLSTSDRNSILAYYLSTYGVS